MIVSYRIIDLCVGCGTCEPECPVGAISQNEDGKYTIDQMACVSCGTCKDACPTGAIIEE